MPVTDRHVSAWDRAWYWSGTVGRHVRQAKLCAATAIHKRKHRLGRAAPGHHSGGAASQNIARLERELGSRLLTRTTRSLVLTEAGQVYLAHVGPVLQQLELAQSDVSQFGGVAQGRLRISCMSSFGRRVLAPLREDVDVGIRYRDALEPGMVVRRIASVWRVLVAPPGYLAVHGGGIAWVGRFIADPLVRTDRLEVLEPAAGVPGGLRFGCENLEFFACFRDRQAVPAKVRALVEFLVQRLQAHPSLQPDPESQAGPPDQ